MKRLLAALFTLILFSASNLISNRVEAKPTHALVPGSADAEVQRIYQALPKFVEESLKSSEVKFNVIEIYILGKMGSYFKEEFWAYPEILFKSEKTEPGFFLVDGKVQYAVTGLDTGYPIYLNADLIVDADGKLRSEITSSFLIALLVHELGHHQGIKECEYLQTLGEKVALTVK